MIISILIIISLEKQRRRGGAGWRGRGRGPGGGGSRRGPRDHGLLPERLPADQSLPPSLSFSSFPLPLSLSSFPLSLSLPRCLSESLPRDLSLNVSLSPSLPLSLSTSLPLCLSPSRSSPLSSCSLLLSHALAPLLFSKVTALHSTSKVMYKSYISPWSSLTNHQDWGTNSQSGLHYIIYWISRWHVHVLTEL